MAAAAKPAARHGIPFKLRKTYRGNYVAQWGQRGRPHRFDTGTEDADAAFERAIEEYRRQRVGPKVATPEKVNHQPDPPPSVLSGHATTTAPAPANTATSPRLSLLEALHRVQSPPPSGISPPSGPAAAVVPDAVISPAKPAESKPDDDEKARKTRHVHKVIGKGAAMAIEGCLKRLCKWAGREPEDMDDDEMKLIREGCEEVSAEYFGRKQLTPWGMIAAGTAVAGINMYVGGKPIPKPPKPTLKLVPDDAVPVAPSTPPASQPRPDGSPGAA